MILSAHSGFTSAADSTVITIIIINQSLNVRCTHYHYNWNGNLSPHLGILTLSENSKGKFVKREGELRWGW